jgi:hypothetical protein
MDKLDLRSIWDGIWPFVPPSIGAYFGLRYAQIQDPKERVVNWFSSAFLSVYLAQAIGEYWNLGVKSTAGLSIIIAMLLSEVVGILVAVARQFIGDPVGTFRRWLNAWLGRAE